jgi:hypothetical protein
MLTVAVLVAVWLVLSGLLTWGIARWFRWLRE